MKNYSLNKKMINNKNLSDAQSKHLFPPITLFTSKKAAFTLAEVLITLGIIGIVAAMTIPTLISDYQEKAYVSKVKKVYSMLSQAYKFVELEYGNPTTWNLEKWQMNEDATSDNVYTDIASAGSADLLGQRFAEFLKVNKMCLAADKDCMDEIDYKYLKGTSDAQHFRGGRFNTMILSDGTIIYNYISNVNCGEPNEYGVRTCASFYADVNGTAGPNRRGVDFFEFRLTDRGIVPNGLQGTVPDVGSFDESCSDKDTMRGDGCAAWIIHFNNMDYLHCSGLSWNGAHSCEEVN